MKKYNCVYEATPEFKIIEEHDGFTVCVYKPKRIFGIKISNTLMKIGSHPNNSFGLYDFSVKGYPLETMKGAEDRVVAYKDCNEREKDGYKVVKWL